MTRRAWVRLDNASNIFLAARSDVDPKVFRISAELDHDVDPGLLQQALDATYERYRLYHAVLRRGVFWHYLQDSDLRPRVTAEEQHTCAPIYRPDRRELLFRVMHHRTRIILELFHALSDGTGALWFLTDMVEAYVRLRHPRQMPEAGRVPGRDDDQSDALAAGDPGFVPAGNPHTEDLVQTVHELTTDSFTHYFRRRRRREPAGPAAGAERPAPLPGARSRKSRTKVYRVTGTRTPDNRPRVVELTMPADEVLQLARAEGVSLTMYLTAVFFESIRLSSPGLGRARTLVASVPVNLRQFFPSTSPRNFFAIVRVEHTYGDNTPDKADPGPVSRSLERGFRPEATPAALEKRLRRLIRFERMPVLRIVPRPVKDVLLRLINWISNRRLTVAVSNLGRVTLPEPADSHVRRMLFHVSAVRPQFCAMSHAGLLTISFTSPFTQTDHIREFARMLTSRGVEVTAAAAQVTEDELQENGQ